MDIEATRDRLRADIEVLAPTIETELNPLQLVAYIDEYAKTGLRQHSAHAAGTSRHTIFDLRKRSPEFKKLDEDAKECHIEMIHQTVKRRAVEGWEEPVYYQGIEVGSITKFSDRMLELYAKKHDPSYRERSTVDMNVFGGVLVVPGMAMTPGEWEAKHGGDKALPES